MDSAVFCRLVWPPTAQVVARILHAHKANPFHALELSNQPTNYYYYYIYFLHRFV